MVTIRPIAVQTCTHYWLVFVDSLFLFLISLFSFLLPNVRTFVNQIEDSFNKNEALGIHVLFCAVFELKTILGECWTRQSFLLTSKNTFVFSCWEQLETWWNKMSQNSWILSTKSDTSFQTLRFGIKCKLESHFCLL